jgi:nucleotide-binding universal stress UspA family protein
MAEKLFTLARLSNPRAQLIKARLESESIEVVLTNLNQIKGSVPAAKVMINEKDLPTAMRILREIESEYGPDEIDEMENEDLDRILVPIDFSAVSEKAAGLSISLASKLNADIRLLHAYFNPAMGTAPFNETNTYQDAMSSYLRDMHLKAKTRLVEMTNTLRKRISDRKVKEVDIDYYLTMGDPAAEILRISKRYNPNVIVMPIRHRAEKDNSLISSVTANVIDSAKYPVLAIPKQFNKQNISEFKNILYISNYDNSELKAIKNLMRLLAPLGGGVNVHVLHVCEGELTEAHKYQLQVLEEFFKRYNKVNFTGKNLVCKSKESVEQINKYIEENQIDILSLVNYKRSLISRLLYPSFARRMVFQSKTPLLVFPGEDD